MAESIATIAKMIDRSLLHPTMTDVELADGCGVALEHVVAAVCIKPYAVSLARRILEGSGAATPQRPREKRQGFHAPGASSSISGQAISFLACSPAA